MNRRVLFSILLLTACQPVPIVLPPAPTVTVPSTATAIDLVAGDAIVLPTPQRQGTLSVEEALAQRRSVRTFSDTPLALAELGQLLWAAQGITDPTGLRTAPSAGALYPLEVYAVTAEGVYRYDPASHHLVVLARGDMRQPLYNAALHQAAVLNAPTVIVIAADYARTAVKYGEERSQRYVQLEAGHAAQNILLQAVALNLGAVTIGAFEDAKVKQALALPDNQQPLYLIPVGHPSQRS